jgi:hypothetical protein
VALLTLYACGWQVPADPDAPAVLNVLSGDVVVSGTSDVATTYVLLYDALDPPPPAGTGSPVSFAAVSASTFTGDGAGIQAAPYFVTRVPDGAWLLAALMDVDGDFDPLRPYANGGATCGDWVGAHVSDLATGEAAPVTVSGGVLLDDVTVVVGVPMTTERPAFTLGTSGVSQTSPDPQLFTLDATGIHSTILDLADPGTDPCGAAFVFYAPDADGDGQPDPNPDPDLAAEGLLDLWPRVYLQYLSPAAGESWSAQAVVYPAPLLDGEATVGVPALVTSLEVVWVPAALHTLADGTQEVVTAPDLPAGAWSVTVVESTGQTWTLPNEVAAYPASDPAFDPSTQGATLGVE